MQDRTDQRQPEAVGDDRRAARPAREAIIVFALVTLGCALMWRLGQAVPFVGRHLHVFIAALFLYVPTWLLNRRGERFEDFGMTAQPVGRGLAAFGLASAIVFPLFGVGFVLYYRAVCAGLAAGYPLPSAYRSMCARFAGSWGAARWRTGFWRLLNTVAAQLIVVALPEEYFFRGYVQTQLFRAWPAKRTFLGARVGWALIVTCALFALGHVLVDFNGLRLAVFFPALLFGWLRESTGSILAPVLFHASANLVSHHLHRALF